MLSLPPLPARLGRSALAGLFALCASTLSAQSQITWTESTGAGRADLKTTADVVSGSSITTVLQNIRLIDLEITNRTRGRGLDGTISRRVVRDGLAFVELPGNGSLYAYERNGQSLFGFLHIDRQGNAVVIDERSALGSNQNPYDDRIGVAFDGLHAALPLLDGRVVLARLDGGVFGSTGTPSRFAGLPGSIETTSLCPLVDVLICGNENDRVFVIPYADGSTPIDRTPPASGSDIRLKSEFVMSKDGRRAVFLHGPRDFFTIYRLDQTGPALALQPPAAKYEEPGYLPETDFGPRLHLDDDGSHLFYVDSSIRDEAYTLDIATGATAHVTGDANFQPYIGVVVLPLAIADAFVTAIGDPAEFDLYATHAQFPQVFNMTTTNGNFTAPFDVGNLDFRALGMSRNGTLFFEAHPTLGGAGALTRLGVGGWTVLSFQTLDAPQLGSSFGASGDLWIETNAGHRCFDGTDLQLRLSIPSAIQSTLGVVRPAPGGGSLRVLLLDHNSTRYLALENNQGLAILPVASSMRHAAIQDSGSVVLAGTSLQRISAGRQRMIVQGTPSVRVLSGRSTTAL